MGAANNMLVLLFLVSTAVAGPITVHDSAKCSTQCSDSSKFKYNPGTTYEYDYRVDTDSSLAGAFEDSAKTTIQTSVNIEVLSPCEFALVLKNTRLIHTDVNAAMKTCDRENEFRSEVEGSVMRFSYQNGVVDHVCAEKEESVRSLNFKKGILSTFQNSMDDLTQNQNVTETDIAGVCKTEYKLVSEGYYTTEVKKVKNILSCTDRLDYTTMLQLTPYNVPSDLQNFPIMKTTHECDQTVEIGGMLKSAICKESHLYRPFANGENGARTVITQTLVYKTSKNGIRDSFGDIQARSSLVFDHSANHLTQEQARASVEQKLSDICETTKSEVRPETSRLFSELVAAMKGLNKQDLSNLHHLLKTNTFCPTNGRTYKFFHDALPMVSTSASVSLMTELINSKDATGLEATAWLTSLAFIRNPTSDMLLDVKILLDNKDIRKDALLPVSSMINNFCKNTDRCIQDSVVQSLISSLERNIDNRCDASGKKFELTLLTLKAIGNAGNTIRADRVLNKCLTSTSNPLEIRVAAAEAFRRMPCKVDDKSLWETFTDSELDSELRINAYWALMRCPTEANLAKIAAILNAEEDEQVGAFVYSHLTNLRETSDPHKQGVAEAINNLALDKEFDLSPLKYSRNFEVSALINKINTGITAESNLIWSNKAQLPRAVSGNLTVELFGQAINLFDFGGRLEGLEYLIKNIFGPYVNSDNKESTAKTDSDDVKGSIYGRVFGNDMLFMHSQTTKSLFGDKSGSYLDLLIKMSKEQHVALTQTVQFMDVCMVIPSIAGLPIHVTVNGTATVDLNMKGKMDLRKVGASPRSMHVDGEIRPSAALEITGTMFVDSFVTKTGLRMRNTLHTSTAIKGRVELTRGQVLSVELDTPEDKMEIFDARSKFFVLHDNMEQEQEMIKENRKEFKSCSSNQLTKITGMELCGELSFSNASMKADSPYYPLTGPTAVSVTLFKRDSHSGYKLFAKRIENKKASIAQIFISTPGSKVDRAISVDMSLNYKKQNVELNLASPWKKVSLNGNMLNLKELKSLSGNVVIDEKDTYAVTGEVKVSQSKTKIQVTPMLEVRRPGADNVQVTGFISVEKPWKSANLEISLSGINKLPYTVKTALTNTKKDKSIQASMSLDGKNEYSIKASNVMNIMGKKSVIAVIENLLVVQSPERRLMTISSNTDYKQDKSLKHDSSIFVHRLLKRPSTFKVNLVKTARKRANNYKAVLNLKSSLISGNIMFSAARKPNGFTSVVTKIDYSIPKVSRNTINLSGKFNDRSTKAYKSYIVQSSVAIKRNPEYNSNMKIEAGHKKRVSHVSVDVKYGPNPKDKTKRVYFMTSLSRKIANLKNAVLNYKLKAQAPAHEIDVLLLGKHQHTPKLLDSSVTLTYAPKKDISAEVTLRDRSTKLAKINGKAALSWPGTEYVLTNDLTQKSEKQYSHTVNFKSNAGTKHTITTVYKMPKPDSHAAVTSIRLHKMKPIVVSGSTNLNVNNFAASGDFKTGKDVYGFKTMYKFSKAPNAKFGIELIHPSRHVTLDVSGGKSRSKYEGKVEAAWDAAKNKDSKMTLEGSCFHKSAKESVSVGGNVNFQSPFTNFENILGSVKYRSDASQHTATGKMMWAGKANQVTTTMTVKKPISLSNLQINGNLKTPFKGIRNAEIDVAHKLDQDLSTVIKGQVEKESAKLMILGKSLRNGYKGDMTLKSTIKNAENVKVSFSHTDTEGNCHSNAEVNHNGKVYAYDLNMENSGNGWQRSTNGDLVLTMNKKKVATHWEHKNTDESVHSSLSSKWNDKQFTIDLDGSHKLSDLRNINGVLKIQSPWKLVRDIELNIDHKHGKGLINSVAFMKQGQNKKASSVINYSHGQNKADFDFNIASPFRDDVSGKLSTNYDSYPMTSSAELKWAPKMKGTLEGSLNLEAWNNADLNMKLTTPSQTLRNVVLKVSNKKQGEETVSHLNLDYGMRQNIDMESRIGIEDQKKMIRLKLTTPFEHIKSLDTGLNLNHGPGYTLDTNVDFELLPSLGKFDGVMNWQYEAGKEMSGKIRLDTPLPEYPYFEMSTSSTKDGRMRKSHIQAEYYPRQAFSFDSVYVFELPLSFDATIRSPYPEFDDIGVSFQHDLTDSSIKSLGEIKYQSDKKIEAMLNADWTSDVNGNVEVKTPFRGYESNKITLRHRGQLDNFDTRGEVDVAQQNFVADASFKTGYTTTGTFTFTSPIPALRNIEASIKKKGNKKNMRGDAILKINGDKFQVTFNNKLSKDSLKTGFKLMTPLTDTFELSVDHSGLPESFTNKVNLNYGRKVDINTVASFDLRENDVNGNGLLKYKMFDNKKTARYSFSKSGTIEDLTFTATTGLNRDEISVTGFLKTKEIIEGSVEVKTPFDNFKNTGMTLSHSGDISDFTSFAKINYMDSKNIDGNIAFSNIAGNGIKLTGELTTPFKTLESTTVKFNHDISAYSNDITGTAELTTTVGGFGTGDIAYSKTGDLNDLVLKGSASAKGRDVAVFKLTNNMQDTEVHSMCSLKTSATPDVYLSIDHSGDSFSFDTKTTSRIGQNMLSVDANMKRGYNLITAESSVVYKLQGESKNKASFSMKKDGNLDNCNFEVTGKFNEKEAKVSGSKSGQLNNMHFAGSAAYNKDSIDITGGWKNAENIEATLKVLTPFKKFNNFALVFSHNGELLDFASQLNLKLMDDNINGKVELTAKTLNNIKLMSELTTPIDNFESVYLKFNNEYDSNSLDLNGNAAFDSNINGFGTAGIVYSKTGQLNNLEINGIVSRNGVEAAELKIKNGLQDKELHSSFEFKSSATPLVRLTVDHNGDLKNFKTSARAVLGNKNLINGEATLNQRGTIIDAEGKLIYTIENLGSNQASLTVHKEGDSDKFNIELTGKSGGKMSKITGNFKNADELTGDLTLSTPIKGYKNVGLSFKHSGNRDRFNCEGKIMLIDGEEYSGKIDFYRYLTQRIETVIEVKTPIPEFEFTKYEYRHEGQSDSFTCSSSLQYGKSNNVNFDLSAKSTPKPEITATLKINDDQVLLMSGSYENTWPKYGFSGKYDAGKDYFVTLDGSLDVSDDVVGSLTMSTPIDSFNNVGLSFQHSLKSNSMNTEGKIMYMDGKEITGKADAKLSKTSSQVSVELTTPFEGYRMIQFDTKHVFNKRINKATTTLVYGNNKSVSLDAYTKFKPSPEASVTISGLFEHDIVAFVSVDNSWAKYKLVSKLSPGNGDQFTLDGTFDATNDISGSLMIGTPFNDFKKVGMNFLHSGSDEKFGTEGTVTYMDGQEIFGKANFYRYLWNRVDASLELTTPFNGMESTKAEINFEDNSDSISTTAALEYNNGQKLNGNMKVIYSPNYEVLVTLNTPFNDYNVIRAQGSVDITAPTYEAMSSLSYGYNKVYSVDGKFSLYAAEHVDGSVEVTTPLSDYEFTKVEYMHKANSDGLDGSISFTYEDGKKISCDVKSTLSPNFDGTVTVKSPFRGFEKMQGTATFDSSYNKYETSTTLNLGSGSIYSISSELDYSIEPLKASTKISTPFKHFRNVELAMTHEGNLYNFKTTGFMSSPLTDHINAKASLRYDALLDMSAAASLQSSLKGFDDLKAELKTSELAGEMKTEALIGWTNGEQVTYDGLFRKQDGWNEDKMHAEVSITTPFVAVKKVNLQMDHSAQTDSYVEKMNFELNGASLLDFDAEYNFNDKQSAELVVRQPWPMQYTASKSSSDGVTDAEVFANWNRDESNSNVRVQASVTDKTNSYETENGLDLSVTYASRKVGVVHKLSGKSSELMSNGHVYWDTDDDSKVSYEMQMNDNSRRNKQLLDGSFKLGLPTRSLGLTGSYSKNAAATTTKTVFSWDADRDDSKQVGVKAIFKGGDNLKGDITLSLPSMRKEIRVNGEVMLNNGRVILDTQTDISYSKDARRTLTLTSKLEDISNRNSHFNYSLALGVKHPFTNVDIEMNSHIGSSDEKMTLGVNTNYLTSKKQIKNLALLSEINVLKKQISVQIFNPVNTIEVVGDVVSEKPYKLRLMNKIDGVESFRSDMTIDSHKKTFHFNTFTDSDILSFSAKYPNKTAFRVDFTRHTPSFDQEEALLAVCLNTSRLLHTRLSWRPDMMQEFTDYAWPRALEKAETVVLGLTSFNQAVSEEISRKYGDISKEMSRELGPLITVLNEELAIVADKMTELSVELREMYNHNDFYIQDMGDSVLKLQEKLQRLSKEYRTAYTDVISSLRGNLRQMRKFPIRAYYTQFMTESAEWLVKESVESLASLEQYMAEVDLALKEYKSSIQNMKQRAMDTIKNATYIDYLANKISQVQNIDISPYISSFDMPEQYTNIIYSAPSQIRERLNDVLDGYKIKEGLNEVYQQGVWAYNYWQVEENLEKHAKSILKNLKDIVEDELKEYSEDLDLLGRNPIKVWDPEHGEIQADIPLPIAVKSLEELPDFTPIVKKVEKFAITYLPDQGTWDNLVEYIPEFWSSNSTEKSDLIQQFRKFKPSQKNRKNRRKYRIKKFKQ